MLQSSFPAPHSDLPPHRLVAAHPAPCSPTPAKSHSPRSRKDQLQLRQRPAQHAKQRLRHSHCSGGYSAGGKHFTCWIASSDLGMIAQLFDKTLQACGVGLLQIELQIVAAKACPPLALSRRHQMNQCLPMFEIVRNLFGQYRECRPIPQLAKAAPLYPSACPISPASSARSCMISLGTLCESRVNPAHIACSSAFCSRGSTVPSRYSSSSSSSQQRHQLPPLVPQWQHLHQQPLAIRQASIAMQQHCSQRRIQLRIVAAQLHQRLPRRFAIHRRRIFHRRLPAAASRQHRQRTRDLSAH